MTWSDPHYSAQYLPPPPPPYNQPPYQQPDQPQRRPSRKLAIAVTAGVVGAAVALGGVAVANNGSLTISGSGSTEQLLPTLPNGGGTNGGTNGGGTNGGGTNGGGTGGGTTGGGTASGIALATDKQKVGIVTIVSVLGYQNAEGAGTGMVLTSNGEVLTNNHVVNGATSVTVTVVSTGKSYRADVVGTAPTEDVAVLQLRNASGLATAKVGDSDDVNVGDSVIGVGNAGGTSVLRASSGKVTALDQTITASDETGQNSERLHGLIGVNAPIVAGDSGGPMYGDNGTIIGMNTAASQSGTAGSVSAYAIPIDSAEKIADQIESGVQTSTIHIGLPGFMGVGVEQASGGVAITSVVPNGPAARAGITPGSVVTGVGKKHVSTPAGLKQALSGHKANSKVKITWTDPSGSTHTSTVTLTAGPAD